MTDDLVKRLREGDEFERFMLAERAADRIEALEARMAKAAEALDQAWWMLTVPYLNYEPEPEEPGLRCIKTALEELKEQK
jgi:hypothetical protein